MNDQPSARDMIPLPGPFLFKVIGKPELVTNDHLKNAIHTTLDRDPGAIKVSLNTSKNGRYHAYSIALHIQVYDEIEALYAAFRNLDGVVTML